MYLCARGNARTFPNTQTNVPSQGLATIYLTIHETTGKNILNIFTKLFLFKATLYRNPPQFLIATPRTLVIRPSSAKKK